MVKIFSGNSAEKDYLMDALAPPLTREGFQRGCSQPGAARPMMETVNVGKADITFTSGGIIIATDDPELVRQLADAKGAVGDRITRINRR